LKTIAIDTTQDAEAKGTQRIGSSSNHKEVKKNEGNAIRSPELKQNGFVQESDGYLCILPCDHFVYPNDGLTAF
jgi:hypothetical protein